MHVRVVRFTDVDRERVEALLAQVQQSGPPPGVNVERLQFALDSDARTAVVLQWFASAEDMEAAGRIFDAMDPGETPGTRASVDSCELRLEVGSS